MMTETKERIKNALLHLDSGRITISDAWQYCNELERLNSSESADLMKTLIKTYDAWCKRYGMTASKAFKF